jgi:glycerol uptake facilitator protein
MHEHALARRAAAEVVGTALLVFVGAGSVAALLLLGDGKPFSGADLGFVALAFGFAVVASVYVLGPISGSHINPAVTVALAATRRFPWRDVPAYVAAQLVGATVGALLMWGVLGSRGTSLGRGFGMAFFDGSATSWGSAFLAEALAAGILVFVVLGAIDRDTPQSVAGVVIGLALAGIVLVIGPVTCAATNPARAFGPLLVQTLDGSGAHNWLQFLGVYVPAELLGGVLAALGYDALRGKTAASPSRSSGESELPSAASAGSSWSGRRGPTTTDTRSSARSHARARVAGSPRRSSSSRAS